MFFDMIEFGSSFFFSFSNIPRVQPTVSVTICAVLSIMPLRLPPGVRTLTLSSDSNVDVFTLSDVTCKTKAQADIVLLVDGSWSIGRLNFRTIRAFIARMVGVFDIGPDRVQVGR